MFQDPVPLGSSLNHSPRQGLRSRVLLAAAALAGIAYFQTAHNTYGSGTAVSGRIEGSQPGRGFRPRTSYATPREGIRLAPTDVADFPDAHFYDVGTLRTLFVQFQNSAWETDLAARYHTQTDLPAAVTIDGRTYRDVGVRFRGNSSYRMVPQGLKRSLNVSLDAVHADQHAYGYRTLNLLNANSDPTFVRAVLYSEIARKYLPAPKVNFVRVVINGENWGIYLNSQQFNKDFLRDFYGTTAGARWKVPGSPRGRAGLEYLGESIEPYRGLYELKSKDDPKAWSDLVRLCRLLNTTPPEKLEAVLAPHLDVDGALRFLAIDLALVNTDGYWTRASDYSIFQDARGQFHILTYDFNEGMGVQGIGRRGSHGSSVALEPLVGLDDLSKPLRSKLLAVPDLRRRYLAYVRDIAENWMDWNTLAPLVRQYQSLIEADVKMDGRKLYALGEFGPATLQRFFEQRRAFLLQNQEGHHD